MMDTLITLALIPLAFTGLLMLIGLGWVVLRALWVVLPYIFVVGGFWASYGLSETNNQLALIWGIVGMIGCYVIYARWQEAHGRW